MNEVLSARTARSPSPSCGALADVTLEVPAGGSAKTVRDCVSVL